MAWSARAKAATVGATFLSVGFWRVFVAEISTASTTSYPILPDVHNAARIFPAILWFDPEKQSVAMLFRG